MKKLWTIIGLTVVGVMLSGCYTKSCEQPMQPVPYKDEMPPEKVMTHHHHHHHHHHQDAAQ